MAGRSQRRSLGGLFVLLAAAFAGVAYGAAKAEQWVILGAALVLGLWLLGLAVRALKP